MQIYSTEINDNLAERMEHENSIAFDCDILSPEAINVSQLFLDSFNSAKSFIEENKDVKEQKDLYYLNSVLVSAGWNKNDDVFGVEQLWEAKDTPVNKQFNYMHDDTDIIGHITASMVVDHDGNPVKQSATGTLPEKIDIITSAVIYKTWSDPHMKERIQTLTEEIDQGKWSVSMECIFSDFDYAIVGPDNKDGVLKRTEQSAFLTKHLKAYGGSGEYQGYKIGRLLKSYYFSGKGLVAKPANPRSIIFSKGVNPFNAKANITFNNFLTAMEHNMSDNTKQIEDLQAELKSAKDGFDAEKSEIEKTHQDALAELKAANDSAIAEKETLISSLELQVKELQDSAEAMTKDKEKMQKEAEAFKKDMEKKEEELKGMKEKYAAMMKEMKGMKRMASLIDAGATEEAAAKILDDFAEADDDMFNSVVALIDDGPKPTPEPEPEPCPEPDEDGDDEEADASSLEEVTEVADATLANPESDEENRHIAIASAASWLRESVLKSTKNLK